MAENLMSWGQKATNETYRDNYDAIFGKKETDSTQEVEDGNSSTNDH